MGVSKQKENEQVQTNLLDVLKAQQATAELGASRFRSSTLRH
jgi:hypothetical protein